MKTTVLQFFADFYEHAKLTKGINSTFVTLIPKTDCPTNFKDYRPTSMVGWLYKLFSKVLANRMKCCISSLIGEAQAAFIGGKQILDGVLIANKVIHFWKTKSQGGLILKLDFEWTYDCVNWSFLLDLLLKMGCGQRWCRWVRECISSVSMSILVNGLATKEFHLQKGIRQGDSLFPFFFNIAAEALYILLGRARDKNLFKAVQMGENGVFLSHLQYADDTIIFCNNDLEEICIIKRILRCFQLMSRLKINFSKSSLCGVKVQVQDVKSLAYVLGCKVESLPIKYLGLPLVANPRRIKT